MYILKRYNTISNFRNGMNLSTMDKDLEQTLTSKGVAPTTMRLLVMEFILKQNVAVNLPGLQKKFPYADRTTLYRTLKTFEEHGLIHIISDGLEATKYALCEAECKPGVHADLHVHFYCLECKELSCLPKSNLPGIEVPEHYQLRELTLLARGVCRDCTLHPNNAIKLHEGAG